MSLIPDNEHCLARMKIEKRPACAFKESIQMLMIAHNMSFATRDRPLLHRQCGRALSSVEMDFAIWCLTRRWSTITKKCFKQLESEWTFISGEPKAHLIFTASKKWRQKVFFNLGSEEKNL
jgi:hypothetical protein